LSRYNALIDMGGF